MGVSNLSTWGLTGTRAPRMVPKWFRIVVCPFCYFALVFVLDQRKDVFFTTD